MDRARYLLGLLTLALTIAGGVFLFDLLGDRGDAERYRLQLEFKSVRGLKSGADVRFRGVTIGSVRHVRLAEDGKRGVVTLLLEHGYERHCCFHSRFWIVAPRFTGLAGGATGLDTLIRDAYVAFTTPEPSGPQLPNGSLVPGHERPSWDDDEGVLAPLQRGDLQMTLLVAENHALQPGARVMLRGVPVGDVRRIELAEDGSHVRLGLRIDRGFRSTVTDRSRFWIARPRLSGALLSGIDVQDVGALLGTYIAYYTEPGQGLPVADGFACAAAPERPEFKLADVPGKAVAALFDARKAASESRPSEDLRVVRIAYSAVGTNWWSPDDPVQRSGTGVLYEDKTGRLVVLTARSACDAAWCLRDVFGIRPNFRNEEFRVVLADGQVLRAGRGWVAPDELDLALLLVEDAPAGTAASPPALLAFAAAAPAAGAKTLLAREGGTSEQELDPKALPRLDTMRGALVVHERRAIGLLAQTAPRDETPKLVLFASVPELLRPRP